MNDLIPWVSIYVREVAIIAGSQRPGYSWGSSLTQLFDVC